MHENQLVIDLSQSRLSTRAVVCWVSDIISVFYTHSSGCALVTVWRLLGWLCVCVRVCQIFWQLNGQRLDVASDTNLIISNDGNLIVSQARLRDAGNYSCGAQNIVGRRLSDPARLSVFGIYLLTCLLNSAHTALYIMISVGRGSLDS